MKPRQHNLVEPRAIREADATMTKHGNRKKDYVAIPVPFFGYPESRDTEYPTVGPSARLDR